MVKKITLAPGRLGATFSGRPPVIETIAFESQLDGLASSGDVIIGFVVPNVIEMSRFDSNELSQALHKYSHTTARTLIIDAPTDIERGTPPAARRQPLPEQSRASNDIHYQARPYHPNETGQYGHQYDSGNYGQYAKEQPTGGGGGGGGGTSNGNITQIVNIPGLTLGGGGNGNNNNNNDSNQKNNNNNHQNDSSNNNDSNTKPQNHKSKKPKPPGALYCGSILAGVLMIIFGLAAFSTNLIWQQRLREGKHTAWERPRRASIALEAFFVFFLLVAAPLASCEAQRHHSRAKLAGFKVAAWILYGLTVPVSIVMFINSIWWLFHAPPVYMICLTSTATISWAFMFSYAEVARRSSD